MRAFARERKRGKKRGRGSEEGKMERGFPFLKRTTAPCNRIRQNSGELCVIASWLVSRVSLPHGAAQSGRTAYVHAHTCTCARTLLASAHTELRAWIYRSVMDEKRTINRNSLNHFLPFFLSFFLSFHKNRKWLIELQIRGAKSVDSCRHTASKTF